jgi:hypothetical protein
MKTFFMIMLLVGCAHHAVGAAVPPRGEEVFYALLKNDDIHLLSEPLCNDDIKLYEQLALAFSVSFNSKNTTTLKSSCLPSKFEDSTGKVEDVWDCTIQINENNNSGDFISSSTFVLSLTSENKELVNGSLRCY